MRQGVLREIRGDGFGREDRARRGTKRPLFLRTLTKELVLLTTICLDGRLSRCLSATPYGVPGQEYTWGLRSTARGMGRYAGSRYTVRPYHV